MHEGTWCMSNVNEILDFNKWFVDNKQYEKYKTTRRNGWVVA